MATHSSILAWRIPRPEEPGGYSPRGRKESDTTKTTQHARTHKPAYTSTTTVATARPGVGGLGFGDSNSRAVWPVVA